MNNTKEITRIVKEFVKCHNLKKLRVKKDSYINDNNLKLIEFKTVEYVGDDFIICEYYQHPSFSFQGVVAKIVYFSQYDNFTEFYRVDKSRIMLKLDNQKEENGKIIRTCYILNGENKVFFTNESDNEECNNYRQLAEFEYNLNKLGFTVLPHEEKKKGG